MSLFQLDKQWQRFLFMYVHIIRDINTIVHVEKKT